MVTIKEEDALFFNVSGSLAEGILLITFSRELIYLMYRHCTIPTLFKSRFCVFMLIFMISTYESLKCVCSYQRGVDYAYA
ncbi:hypothetical protein DFH11DRAFT_1598232 [Phellopilus nigrolimitatus]|nr:hypothetical protein DFH11DRAFT_1598232 [Phellopilus nigrolimitatus]